ncbi:uncharacterized protein LOC127845079 [Dreissena polymorpha]|uniref:EF-hand domain-containing protein n=1 Tax=Dreissena polymorpha TaxID=45954 RepID=A0A9D4E0H7_DREPO|nr:uncharacterized protein LOC127845079 [Dreissena polymorpha]KAH3771507.1 hypothetical protein DPMN_172829 [Dreissena polymorpha]
MSSYFGPDTPDVVIKSLFKKYDTDNSGCIGRKELASLLEDDLGLTSDQADVYVHLLDKDGSAKISPDEFCAWLRSNERFSIVNDTSRFYAVSKAVEMFQKYDKDGSQCISCEEFKGLLTELGHTIDFEAAFKAIDKDGNGKVAFPEFLKWLNWVPLD